MRRAGPLAWLGIALFSGGIHNALGGTAGDALRGRRVPAPPVVKPGFRQWPADPVETQLRNLYTTMGGDHWLHNEGWSDAAKDLIPVPPPPPDVKLELRNLSRTLLRQCDGQALLLAAPVVTENQFDGRSTLLKPWSMPMTVPATAMGHPIVRLLREEALSRPTLELLQANLPRPAPYIDMQIDVLFNNTGWQNVVMRENNETELRQRYITSANLSDLIAWGEASTSFYRAIATFGTAITSVSDATTSVSKKGFGIPPINGTPGTYSANETVEVVVDGISAAEALSFRGTLLQRIEALAAEEVELIAALADLDEGFVDADMENRLTKARQDLATARDNIKHLDVVAKQVHGVQSDIVEGARADDPYQGNLTVDDDIKHGILLLYSHTLSDVEKWCWSTPQLCQFRLRRFPIYATFEIPDLNGTNDPLRRWNGTDENHTLDRIMSDYGKFSEFQIANSFITNSSEPGIIRFVNDIVRGSGGTSATARRLLGENLDNLESQDPALVTANTTAERLRLNVWIDYRLNITMEISTEQYSSWNYTEEQAFSDMVLLHHAMPTLYGALRDIILVDTGMPKEDDPRFPVSPLAVYGDFSISIANATANETDSTSNESALSLPFGVHHWQDWRDWRWNSGWGWDRQLAAKESPMTMGLLDPRRMISTNKNSSLALEWYLQLVAARHLDELYDTYTGYAQSILSRSCTYDLIANNTFCSNRLNVGSSMSIEECAEAVEQVGPELDYQCVPVNHVFEDPGRVTCDCVTPTNPCLAAGTCTSDPVCRTHTVNRDTVCSNYMFSDGDKCHCVPRGQVCQAHENMTGVGLYRRRCASAEDKHPMLRFLSQTQSNVCAFWDAVTALARRSAIVLPNVTATCNDKLQNGDEVGVDCGGSCAECFVPHPLPCRELWHGVFCEDGKLVRLDLHGNNVSGQLTAALPSTLRFLDLGQNRIRGTIPGQMLVSLPLLRYIDFSSNMLTGGLPNNLQTLQGLRHFSVAMNAIADQLPSKFYEWPAIEYFNARSNRIRGDLSLARLEQMPFLRHLNLRGNLFDGRLPFQRSADGNSNSINSSLVYLDLSENSIEGTLPPDLMQLAELRYVNLASNILGGRIPGYFDHLTKLNHLDLSANALEGSIPSTFTALVGLQYASLVDNRLSGELPQVGMGSLRRCQSLLLSRNHLSGTLPQDLGAMVALRTLDVSRNLLSGTLPQTLEMIRHTIEDINLGDNFFQVHSVPEMLCEEQAGNICRGAGACVKRACECADGSTGTFCETVDPEDYAELEFSGRAWFDTAAFGITMPGLANFSASNSTGGGAGGLNSSG